MGYQHIDNLYKNKNVLLFKEVYALEKIHGTSAHVGWKGGRTLFFPGGERLDPFMACFDEQRLKILFAALGHDEVVVHGEAYGGRCQGMSSVYGPKLKFVAFEVKIGEVWLAVPNAHDVCDKLGIEFVHYERGPAELEWLDAQRDKDSVQAIRNGMGPGKKGEGIVIRPLVEVQFNKSRIVAKHKRDDFRETLHARSIEKAQVEADTSSRATDVAVEWMTDERLRHVLDRLRADRQLGDAPLDISFTSEIVKRSIADVQRESDGLVPWVPEVRRAVGARAAAMFKKLIGFNG